MVDASRRTRSRLCLVAASSAVALGLASFGGSAGATEKPALTAAKEFIAQHPAFLHASKGDAFIAPHVEKVPEGLQYVTYQRTHDGLPVVGGDFVVATDAAGRILRVNVAQTKPIGGLDTPSVTAARATDVAKTRFSRVDSTKPSRLVVYAKGTPRLAWESRVTGIANKLQSDQLVYVDAHDGKVLGARDQIAYGTGEGIYNGPPPLKLDTTKSGNQYVMKAPNGGPSCRQYHTTQDALTSSDDEWGGGNAKDVETACVDALYSAQVLQDMLADWFGRDGIDGKGGWRPVNLDTEKLGAHYGADGVILGQNEQGEWISELDVVDHEYGHGIDYETGGGGSDRGTLEFVADVFGAMAEHYAHQKSPYDTPDYAVADMSDVLGDGPIRTMYNPSLKDDPNCYTSDIGQMEVHTAAGPGNHWFYLTAEGSNPAKGPSSPTCNKSSVKGIGIEKAGKIFYNALLLKVSENSYLTYRTDTLTAAKNLYGCGTEFATVKAAWDAVDVPAQKADPTCK